MLPEAHSTRKDRLRDCFEYISKDAKGRLNTTGMTNFRLYTYEELGGLSERSPDDWRHDGCVRSMLYGLDGRKWLVSMFNLWFTADKSKEHRGLLFTADARLGIKWLHHQKTDEAFRAAECLLYFSEEGERLMPTFRSYFQGIRTGGRRLMAGAEKLDALRKSDYLRLMGVEDQDDDDDEPGVIA